MSKLTWLVNFCLRPNKTEDENRQGILLLADETVKLWWSAWILMWAAVGNQLYIDNLYDTGSVH